jgi:hypothetical protein
VKHVSMLSCSRGILGIIVWLVVLLSAAAPVYAQSAVQVSALDVFDVTPAETVVVVDGRPVGSVSKQIVGIVPGMHDVTLRAEGYFDHSVRLMFTAGEPSVISDVALKSRTASLLVNVVYPQTVLVYLDERRVGYAGRTLDKIEPGEHVIWLRSPGHIERRIVQVFVANELVTLPEIRLERAPAHLLLTVNIMGAEIVVDGKVIGKSTGSEDRFEIPADSAKLEVRRPRYVAEALALHLVPGGEAKFSFDLQRVGAPAPQPSVPVKK